jgi:NADPH:quinone reductase-like Zn-dependent oxidoreductase/thioesterase domain-containing protein/acyl carrier protein
VVNVAAMQVIRIPLDFDLVGAATMPVVYGTVLLGLKDTAGLKAGESVLVHSAAGGVGLAAVNYARHAGARLFVTAGSPAKRLLLEKYEPEGIMDSRSLGFSDELLAATNGRGVDVVLNSLAGQAMVRTLACIAPEGRFIEIGKRDFYEQTRVSLWPLRRNASFHAVDLGYHMAMRPEKAVANVADALTVLAQDVEALPPLPARVYPIARVADALRLLSQGIHVGKIVLDLTQSWGQVRAALPNFAVRADRTYLITGAFGGVGRNIAGWLVDRGARHLVLLSRSGPPDASVIEQFREAGVEVLERRCDVTDDESLVEVLREVRRTMPPLAGVFHPAMVLDDSTIANLDPDRFERVFRPKVHGAWNLHRHTADESLDCFVLFSSVSAWIGSYGQASYAAANAALEALAWHRHQQGLPASAVALGVLGEVGYVAARQDLAQNLAGLGLAPIGAADVRRALELMLIAEDPVAVVARVDWQRLAQKVHGPRRRVGLLADLVGETPDAATASGGAGARDAILAADPADQPRLLTELIRTLAAKVLGMSSAKLDINRPLAALGLDSLMGVELVSLVESQLGVPVPLASLSRDVTIAKLVDVLLPAITGTAAKRPAPTQSVRGPEPSLVRLAGSVGAPTVFFIHPAGGDLIVYRELTEALAPFACVQGIQSRMLDGRSAEFATLAEVGASYAKLLVAHDPAGPYRLFGFSFGGLLALETAHALERLGKPVSWVAVVEADHLRSQHTGDPTARLGHFFVEIVRHLQDELGVFERLPLDRLREEAPSLIRATMEETDGRGTPLVQWLLRYVRAGGPVDIVADYTRRVAAHIRLLADPVRRVPSATPIVAWRAKRGLAADLPLAPVPVLEEVRWVDAEHFAVMAAPHCNTLAAQLQDLLIS